LVDAVEHPARVPMAATASKDKHDLKGFIFSPLIPLRHGKNQT
jgi:hypothetical protein